MKIAVCIKRVPDTEARIRIDGSGKAIDGAGVKYVMSPYDEFAVEAGLRTSEAASGEVAVVSVGEAASQEVLRSALAMGAGRGVLLKGSVTQDGLATARALAGEETVAEADLVLLGVRSADGDQQQVGAMLGTILDRPCVTAVTDFTVDGGVVRAKREVEGGIETVELSLPAVLTITKGAFEPRFASLKGIMAAKKKPLEEKEAALPESRLRMESLDLPAAREAGRFIGEGPDAVSELVRRLRDEAGVL